MAMKDTSGSKPAQTTDDASGVDPDTGARPGNRPAQPGGGDQQIVGQTLEQARENGKVGGQIVKEAVARGLGQMDDDGSGNQGGKK